MTTAQRVEAILERVPIARNSDTELWLIYAQKSGLNLTPEQEQIIRDMPTFETITRVRRKLQENGDYQASQAVRQRREFKSKVVKNSVDDLETLGIALGEQPDGSIYLGNNKWVRPR